MCVWRVLWRRYRVAPALVLLCAASEASRGNTSLISGCFKWEASCHFCLMSPPTGVYTRWSALPPTAPPNPSRTPTWRAGPRWAARRPPSPRAPWPSPPTPPWSAPRRLPRPRSRTKTRRTTTKTMTLSSLLLLLFFPHHLRTHVHSSDIIFSDSLSCRRGGGGKDSSSRRRRRTQKTSCTLCVLIFFFLFNNAKQKGFILL